MPQRCLQLRRLRYPVSCKPRSHVGGIRRRQRCPNRQTWSPLLSAVVLKSNSNMCNIASEITLSIFIAKINSVLNTSSFENPGIDDIRHCTKQARNAPHSCQKSFLRNRFLAVPYFHFIFLFKESYRFVPDLSCYVDSVFRHRNYFYHSVGTQGQNSVKEKSMFYLMAFTFARSSNLMQYASVHQENICI